MCKGIVIVLYYKRVYTKGGNVGIYDTFYVYTSDTVWFTINHLWGINNLFGGDE